ncbi:MFS transporter [Streptomyces oryzae]|uniref:MFS transporter n=1 Tax=Streptomyces oryzae TaxID=1434886 RepID=A0ABS3XH88_9ACTN|nr:MFS transporter [Streptomyces oryzae]MBO8194773.1 MFS transporter [Streptomyces oryzae]
MPGLGSGPLVVAAPAVSPAQTVVIAVPPPSGHELAASASATTWVLTAFMLPSAVATPIAGRLGDLLAHRRVLVGCLGCGPWSLWRALSLSPAC